MSFSEVSMRTILTRGIAVLTIVAAAAGCATQTPAPPPIDTAAIQAEIAKIDEGFAQAVSTRDTTTIWNYYAEDASVLPANMPRAHAIDASRAMWRDFLATPRL